MSNLGSKMILSFCLLLPTFVVGCSGGNTITTQEPSGLLPTRQPSLGSTPSRIPSPSVTPTREPTLTPSPTPVFTLDLSEYDPDVFPPIILEHQSPLIARADEAVLLTFDIIQTVYCGEALGDCRLEPLLFYSYGDAEDFQSVPLIHEIVNEMEPLVARLPAANQAGESLRYYAEFSVPEAGYTLRYPVAGTIEVFTASDIRSIELPAEHAVEPGDEVYTFFWGYGPNTVHTAIRGASRNRVGPPAMDVASDGRIAILNAANENVLIYDPREDTYSNVPLPFLYAGEGDLAFDQDGQLIVCDFVGQGGVTILERLPHCYRLSLNGDVVVSAPLFVHFPLRLTEDLRILDDYDYRLIAPFTRKEANSREAQRERQTWKLPCRFVVGTDGVFDWHRTRFADIEAGLAFEIHSDAGLGTIEGFEKTPQGYILMFSGYEQIRAVWISPSGAFLKDVTLPNGQYSVLSLAGDVAVDQDGSLYVMSSTNSGIEIHFEEAP